MAVFRTADEEIVNPSPGEIGERLNVYRLRSLSRAICRFKVDEIMIFNKWLLFDIKSCERPVFAYT